METVKTEKSTKKGPGHNPPIPHPSPKQNAPPISWASMILFLGSNTLFPFKLTYLFRMMVKVTVFTKSPQLSTNRRAGFQDWLSCKNCKIFILLDMPDTMRPTAKITPVMNTINWSLSWDAVLNWSKYFLATTKPIIGKAKPTMSIQIDDTVWL